MMTGLWTYPGEAAVALTVLYGLHWVCFRRETHLSLNRAYLVGALVLAHVIPIVPVPSPFGRPVDATGPSVLADVAAIPAATWAWTDALLAVYFAGAAVVVFRLAWHLIQLARLLWRGQVADCAGDRVVFVEDAVAPFSFLGLIFVCRPPDGRYEELAHIITHERTHVRQLHSLDILLVQAAAALQWFNPFVWRYRDALRDVHEYLADREVLVRGHDPVAYARALLDQHFGGSTLEFAHQFRHSQLRRRLDMLTRTSRSWSAWTYLLAAPVLAVLVFVYAEPQAAGSGMVVSESLPEYVQADVKTTGGQGTPAAEKKAAEFELQKKHAALVKEYEAATDPEQKKALGEKVKQFEKTHGIGVARVDLSDPAAVEDVIAKVSAKMKALEHKSRETADPDVQAKIQQTLQELAKKNEELKATLAQLQAARQK